VVHHENDAPALMSSEEGSNVAHAPTCQNWASGRNTDGLFKQISKRGIKPQTSLIKTNSQRVFETGMTHGMDVLW
jgi:hypothetical protein